MTTKEKSTTTAEEKWAEFDETQKIYQMMREPISANDVSKTSREAYKSALRKAIEGRRLYLIAQQKLVEKESHWALYENRLKELLLFEDILDTVQPH